MISDLIHGNEPLDLLYLEENIHSTWPDEIVKQAFNELHEQDIFGLCECENCDEEEECENMFVVFNPEFLEKVCPYISTCPCCSPAAIQLQLTSM